ncbi:MAG: hypothetical protein ACYC99_10135, partial [Candidatus Geothermincolia bacterium]
SIPDIHEACRILENSGIMIWAGHIIGNLDDTRDDVEALIKMSRQLPLDIADFTVITPYPGTDLYQLAVEQNLIDEFDFAEYCECEPHMHTAHLSRMEIMELEIKAYMKFYGFWAMVGRARRWSHNGNKRWLLDGHMTGIRNFWKFRSKSAWYFWRTYKETVGKTQNTRIRGFSPLVSTPKLYALGAGIGAAVIVLLATMFNVRLYGNYSSLPRAFIIADLLFSSAVVAFVVGAVAAWLAIRSYRRGWIFSVRPRKPARQVRSIAETSLLNGFIFAALALGLATILVVVLLLGGFSSDLSYGTKEVLVTVVAFLTSLAVSFKSVHAVRNGGIRGRPSPSGVRPQA